MTYDDMKEDTIKYKTPLVYYGGKQRIADWICSMIPKHRIYCEPFFGGGAVFFTKAPSFLEVINDKNECLVNFYLQIQNNFEELAAKINTTLYSESMYLRAKLIYDGKIQVNDLDKAVATWIVFTQSRMGGAKAGWKYDNGTDGSHCGIVELHNRQNFCPWIQKRLSKVQICCRDALKVIRNRDTADTFFYLDPPYPGTNQGHYGGYTFDDLENLLHCLKNIKGKFALSNYPSTLIDNYVQLMGWHIYTKTMKKDSVMARQKGAKKMEILLTNYIPPSTTQLTLF